MGDERIAGLPFLQENLRELSAISFFFPSLA